MADIRVWMLFLCLFCTLYHLAHGIKRSQKESITLGQTRRSPASPAPLNIELYKDCALKELAWTYAKKLLPQVM